MKEIDRKREFLDLTSSYLPALSILLKALFLSARVEIVHGKWTRARFLLKREIKLNARIFILINCKNEKFYQFVIRKF